MVSANDYTSIGTSFHYFNIVNGLLNKVPIKYYDNNNEYSLRQIIDLEIYNSYKIAISGNVRKYCDYCETAQNNCTSTSHNFIKTENPQEKYLTF